MSLSAQTIPMLSIVEMLGIEHQTPAAGTVECKCPFCGSKGYKLHVELIKGMFRCNRCGTNGGKLSLYTLLQYGKKYTKNMREEVLPRLFHELGLEENEQKAVKYRAYEKSQAETPYTELSDPDMGKRMEQILKLPVLNLSDIDREKLLKRGLTYITIKNNEYKTINYRRIIKYQPEWIAVRSKAEDWESIKNRNDILKKVPMDQFLAFMTLGQLATEQKIDLNGIPGAFSFSTPSGKLWGLRLYEGILIPIRSFDGLVVAAQIRTENAKCKYMLLSSRGLQDGRTGRCRIHFPLANHEGIRKDSKTMVITEGPLKADVYCCLATEHRHKAMALIGVNSTADLRAELQSNSECTRYYECFDMDKLVNMAVMAGVEKIRKIIEEEGKTLITIYWDADTANQLLMEYMKYADEHKVRTPELCGNSFQRLRQLAVYLHTSGISVSKAMTHWSGEKKGIDDYMFMIA